MVKYYLLGVEKDNIDCIAKLGDYYEKIKDYDNMIKYYTMALKRSDKCFVKLCLHCPYPLKRLQLYITHYIHDKDRHLIINNFNSLSYSTNDIDEEAFLNILTSFDFKEDDKLCLSLKILLKTLNKQIDLIDLHFKYAPEGLGFKEAKEDYLQHCVS
jgi:hypothetical protein